MFPQEKLLESSLRRQLNLAEAWLRSCIHTQEQWDPYKDIFAETLQESREREHTSNEWGVPDESGRGEFILVRPENAETTGLNLGVSSS